MQRGDVALWDSYNKVDNAVSKSKIVQNLLKQRRNLLAKKHGICTRTLYEVKGTCVRAYENLSDLPVGQHNRKLSHQQLMWTVEHST